MTRKDGSNIPVDPYLGEMPEGGWPEFKPCFSYNEAMDWLDVLLADTSERAEEISGIPVTLLWYPNQKKLVGIRIEHASKFVPKEVLENLT